MTKRKRGRIAFIVALTLSFLIFTNVAKWSGAADSWASAAGIVIAIHAGLALFAMIEWQVANWIDRGRES